MYEMVCILHDRLLLLWKVRHGFHTRFRLQVLNLISVVAFHLRNLQINFIYSLETSYSDIMYFDQNRHSPTLLLSCIYNRDPRSCDPRYTDT